MKSITNTLMLTVCIAAQAAESGKRPPYLTGDQLIAELRGGTDAMRLFGKPYARGYIAGVVDATAGRMWCLTSEIPPETADEQVMDALAGRPVGSMSTTAAALLIEQYRSKFPLSGAACSVTPRLDGQKFVFWTSGNRRQSGSGRAATDTRLQELARFTDGYIAGAIDATQERDWCAPARIKPDELAAIAYWAVVELPTGARPSNPATFLQQLFVAKYPCRSHP
jgi:hypothetical protein